MSHQENDPIEPTDLETPPVDDASMAEDASAEITETSFDAPPASVETVPADVPAEAIDDSASMEFEDVVPEAIPRRLGANPHAEMTKPTFTQLKPGSVTTLTDSIALPAADIHELNQRVEQYSSAPIEGPGAAAWAEVLLQTQNVQLTGDALRGAVMRAESYWGQSVEYNGEHLQAGRPRVAEPTDKSKLVGPHAVLRMQAFIGGGAPVRVPLWHSGLWLSFKTPTEAALLELDRRIANEKIRLGRETHGLIFSNNSVYINSYLINFALAHLYDATYKYENPADLKSVIKLTDLPTILWALLCTIYPNGYPYKQPCVNDPAKCLHITEAMLALGKISWTDDRALTQKQRAHMLRRNSNFTALELADYHKEHQFNHEASVALRDNLNIEFRVPTLAEYEASGLAWVDGIVASADQAFGGTMNGEQRNTYIIEQAQVTALRQYGHWIQRLVLKDKKGDEVIEDTQTLQDIIANLTADDEIYSAFFTGVGKFIDRSTISVIAIPKFNCPSCGQPMSSEEKAHPHLIPLDVGSLFFTLLDHRIFKMLARSRAAS